MPYKHRVGTNKIRTDPPVVSIDSNFHFIDKVRVVFVHKFVHLATHFLRATGVKNVLAELTVSDEPVVDTQVELFLAFLLERIRDVVHVIPRLFPVTVPVGSPFLDVIIGNRKEIESVLDEFLDLLRIIS